VQRNTVVDTASVCGQSGAPLTPGSSWSPGPTAKSGVGGVRSATLTAHYERFRDASPYTTGPEFAGPGSLVYALPSGATGRLWFCIR
jgi:hypothetical protein